ncbi:MAG: hypothetical protein Q8934_23060 [Bacillota bacterium]|nr:hypothetical protein [Bacillota bacterium]
MTKSCTRFLESQAKKGGQQAYVAIIILGAIEKKNKDLLKRFNFSCIQQNLAARREQKFSSIFQK